MEPLETIYDLAKDLTIVKAKGKVKAQDLLNWTAEYYSGKVTALILWDFSEADIGDVPMDHLKELAVAARRKADVRRGGKSALVFSRDVDFGLGRMFETLSEIEKTPVLYNSFRDISKAISWLGVD